MLLLLTSPPILLLISSQTYTHQWCPSRHGKQPATPLTSAAIKRWEWSRWRADTLHSACSFLLKTGVLPNNFTQQEGGRSSRVLVSFSAFRYLSLSLSPRNGVIISFQNACTCKCWKVFRIVHSCKPLGFSELESKGCCGLRIDSSQRYPNRPPFASPSTSEKTR